MSLTDACSRSPCSRKGTARCETTDINELYKMFSSVFFRIFFQLFCSLDSETLQIGNSTFGGDFRCQCNPGFTGQFCENDVDECWLKQAGKDYSEACGLYGVCINKVGGYACQCLPGFTEYSFGIYNMKF